MDIRKVKKLIELLEESDINEIEIKVDKLMKSEKKPFISNQFRKGDIRHCYPNVKKAQKLLGFKSKTTLNLGLVDTLGWIVKEKGKTQNRYSNMITELRNHNLIS